jgi:hypothetical protein
MTEPKLATLWYQTVGEFGVLLLEQGEDKGSESSDMDPTPERYGEGDEGPYEKGEDDYTGCVGREWVREEEGGERGEYVERGEGEEGEESECGRAREGRGGGRKGRRQCLSLSYRANETSSDSRSFSTGTSGIRQRSVSAD